MESKVSVAYDRIKHEIVTGKISPETPLSEAYFCNKLGMSRTPVRSALQRLQREGFLRVAPQQGIFIREMSIEEAKQLFDLRGVVESYLIRMSVPKLTQEDFEQLEKMVVEQKNTVASRNYDAFLQMDQDFHNYIYRHYRNAYMLDIVNNFKERFYSWRYQSVSRPGRQEKSIEEHESLLQKLRKGNIPEAVQMLEGHLNQILNMVESRFKE